MFHRAKQLLPLVKYCHGSTRGLWIWGKSGSGKSSMAYTRFPDAFRKNQNKWFDGYTGQLHIILDDLDRVGTGLSHHLKIWMDRYPC